MAPRRPSFQQSQRVTASRARFCMQILLLSIMLSIVAILPLIHFLGLHYHPLTAHLFLNPQTHNHGRATGATTGWRADWGDDEKDVMKTHPFCRRLIDEPLRAVTPLCKRSSDMTCTNGVQKGTTPFFSQVAQDYYVYTRHFVHLRQQGRRGVYIDVGTRHPVTGSNTYFFDACLQWRGVCVEANPDTLAYIHRMRGCELVPTCASDRDGEVRTFVLAREEGGIMETNANVEKLRNGSADSLHTYRIPCMSVQKMCDRRGISVVDFLSVDVEGHELFVLRGIDYDRTTVNVLTVETRRETLTEVEEFLKGKGFVRHWPDLDAHSKKSGLLRADAIFLHESVKWGHPQ